MRFIFAFVALFWIGSIVLSKKRLKATKEKAGWLGVSIACMVALWLVLTIALPVMVYYNNNVNYIFELVFGTFYFYLALSVAMVVAIFVYVCRKRDNDDIVH